MAAQSKSLIEDFLEIRRYWAPRVKPQLIRRLYESDAVGLLDPELLDETGFALLLRCETIQSVTERRCPKCRAPLEGAFSNGPRDRRVTCPDCGWSSTWDAYHRSYKSRRIHGGRAYDHFLTYIDEFQRCRTAGQKMLAIDRLIHALHETLGHGASPAAQNLIEEKKPGRAKVFLDELAYGDQTGTERAGIRESYLKRMERAEFFARKHNEELQSRWKRKK